MHHTQPPFWRWLLVPVYSTQAQSQVQNILWVLLELHIMAHPSQLRSLWRRLPVVSPGTMAQSLRLHTREKTGPIIPFKIQEWPLGLFPKAQNCWTGNLGRCDGPCCSVPYGHFLLCKAQTVCHTVFLDVLSSPAHQHCCGVIPLMCLASCPESWVGLVQTQV